MAEEKKHTGWPFPASISKKRFMISLLSKNKNSFLMVLLLALPAFLSGLAFILDRQVTCKRWDNFNYFLPQIYEAHGRLLNGDIPHLNAFQFMGEPVLSSLQAGVLYPGYTVCVFMLQRFGLKVPVLIELICVLHIIIFCVGAYGLMRLTGVRRSIALAGAYTMVFCGFVTYWGARWIFMLVIISWTPWILGALIVLLDRARLFPAAFIVCCVGVLMQIFVGYPQLTLYAGAWIVPAAVAFFAPRLLRLKSIRTSSNRHVSLVATAYAGWIVAAILLLLSFGQQGGLLRMTYGLPGYIVGITPDVIVDYLPGLASGAMVWDIPYREVFLRSHLAASLNMKYVRAARDDRLALQLLERMEEYKKTRTSQNAVTYEYSKALPRVYFASRVLPFEEVAFREGMLSNRVSVTTVFVEGVDIAEVCSVGTVTNFQERHEALAMDVDAPEGGFLVLFRSYYEQLKAWVDGSEVPLFKVNALICGLFVPPGACNIKIIFKALYYERGLILAGVGILVGLGYLLPMRYIHNRC